MTEMISVKDREPEDKYKHVLAYIPENAPKMLGGFTVCCPDSYEWPYVTYWQELPERPEGHMTDVVRLRKLNKRATLTVTIKVTREMKVRYWLSVQLFKLAAIVLGCGIEVTHD